MEIFLQEAMLQLSQKNNLQCRRTVSIWMEANILWLLKNTRLQLQLFYTEYFNLTEQHRITDSRIIVQYIDSEDNALTQFASEAFFFWGVGFL